MSSKIKTDDELRELVIKSVNRLLKLIMINGPSAVIAPEVSIIVARCKLLCGKDLIDHHIKEYQEKLDLREAGICEECQESPAGQDGGPCEECMQEINLSIAVENFEEMQTEGQTLH